MRIASYNIFGGGSVRLSKLKEAVKLIGADFIGLADTLRWKEDFDSEEIRSWFGYREVFSASWLSSCGKMDGMTVFSNYPIKKFEDWKIGNRKAIAALVKHAGGEILIVMVHLSDGSEEMRIGEMGDLLKKIGNFDKVLIIGDFNAIWPGDVAELKVNVERYWNRSLLGRLSRIFYEKKVLSVLENLYKAKVLPIIKDAGFKEVLLTGNRATALTPLSKYRMPKPIFNIDHIFYRGLNAGEGEVLSGGVFDSASDHYPIVADVNMD